jgi:hypothetical protein
MAGEMFPDETGDDGFGIMAILLFSQKMKNTT